MTGQDSVQRADSARRTAASRINSKPGILILTVTLATFAIACSGTTTPLNSPTGTGRGVGATPVAIPPTEGPPSAAVPSSTAPFAVSLDSIALGDQNEAIAGFRLLDVRLSLTNTTVEVLYNYPAKNLAVELISTQGFAYGHGGQANPATLGGEEVFPPSSTLAATASIQVPENATIDRVIVGLATAFIETPPCETCVVSFPMPSIQSSLKPFVPNMAGSRVQIGQTVEQGPFAYTLTSDWIEHDCTPMGQPNASLVLKFAFTNNFGYAMTYAPMEAGLFDAEGNSFYSAFGDYFAATHSTAPGETFEWTGGFGVTDRAKHIDTHNCAIVAPEKPPWTLLVVLKAKSYQSQEVAPEVAFLVDLLLPDRSCSGTNCVPLTEPERSDLRKAYLGCVHQFDEVIDAEEVAAAKATTLSDFKASDVRLVDGLAEFRSCLSGIDWPDPIRITVQAVLDHTSALEATESSLALSTTRAEYDKYQSTATQQWYDNSPYTTLRDVLGLPPPADSPGRW